ncbi:amidohydrolase family protein, partial [Lysobacter sp. 2RAB21]
DAFLDKIKRFDAGTEIGPRVLAAGFIDGPGPYAGPTKMLVATPEEAIKAVDWYADHGYMQIKSYSSLKPELVPVIADRAHARGLRYSGHVPAFLRAQDVVDQGFDEIQHINQLMLNFFVDDKTDTRTLQRFYLVADKTAGLDFDSKPVQDFIATLAKKQIAIDPTLATFEFLHQRNGELSPIVAGIEGHLPPDVQRLRRSAEMDIPDDATAARYSKSYDKMVEFVGRAYKAGVPLLAGTDEVPGFTLLHELALYVRAGLTPSQALQVATWNAAKVARVIDDRGSVTPGKRSDLILIDGDPTTDIGDIRKVSLVLRGDTAFYPNEVYQALGVKAFAAPAKVTAAK